MPTNFLFDYNQDDKDLIVSQDIGVFNESNDYIRLTIYPTESINNIVDLPNSSKGINGKAVFFSSLSENSFSINIQPFIGNTLFNNDKFVGGSDEINDFKIYKNNTTNEIYLKPNDIFDEFELPQGNYRIQIDFLNQVKFESDLPKFIIKQISTSRKEIRLKLLDNEITNNSDFIENLTNQFNDNFIEIITTPDGEQTPMFTNPPFLGTDSSGNPLPNPNYKYQFKHVLNIGTGEHIPIMNYTFDNVTDGKDNQSLILKLYEPLNTTISNLHPITIEKEVLTTQFQDIFYFSDVPDIFFGDGLETDNAENWISNDNNQIGFQSLDELAISSSLGEIETDYLLSSSEYGYPNLNTNFNEFENHTFFGSAKKKLENFKTKVETIQGFYSEISGTLFVSCSLNQDSPFIIQKRNSLFEKINNEFKTFTPYEKFLYYDAQSTTTASAPSLKNLANSTPLVRDRNFQELNKHDGFNIVYKNSNESNRNKNIPLTNNLYIAHQKPFFNHSGSVYLSFLLKGTTNAQLVTKNTNATKEGYDINGFFLPESTAYKASLLAPDVVSDEYRRFIFEASQSYFVGTEVFSDIAEIDDVNGSWGSGQITILSETIKTASYQIKDSTGLYPTTVVTQSGVPFFGSVMPAGDLFNISILSASTAVTSSFITDVKVSTTNPTNVLPFDNLYHTSSTQWNNWYNNALTQAETFDTNNIHSFENNLPLYIQESNEYNEMKDFLSLQGEQYDLIKSHIDSLGTLNKRGYDEIDSPPNNTLPMLLANMGWDAIYPFQSGSLTETLGNFLSGVTSLDDIKNQTWRKTLNNLVYIYKSKGTKNSVRGLLNVYGYPPDVLQFQEFGGPTFSTDKTDDTQPIHIGDVLSDKLPNTSSNFVDTDLINKTGSVGFTTKKDRLFKYIFNGKQNRKFSLDWWMDDANINTIEFVYKHKKTTNTQTILESSGSNAEKLWDLRLIPSSDGLSSSFEFRLNNSQRADSDIGERGFSMSLAFNKMNDGQLWNVMLQRVTASISGAGIQEYRLHSAIQKNSQITKYDFSSLTVSGGLAGGSTLGGKGFFANQNFQSSGTLHPTTGSPNLIVGKEFSGSLSQIKAWGTTLSTSRFRAHTLNKFSTVGNSLTSYKDDLVYHFKLNENYSTSSVSSSNQFLKIVDSSPTNIYSNYSFNLSSSLFTSSRVYGVDTIDVVKPSYKDARAIENDNGIIISPDLNVINDLNPIQPGVDSLVNTPGDTPPFNTSPKLELFRSPQDFVNDFIINNIGSFNLSSLYGNPMTYYSQSYVELETFKNAFFDANPINVDVNKFIRSHETMFNYSMVDGIKQVIPARSTFSDINSNFGVMIKPTILERQKYENEQHSVETNPNTFTSSITTSPDFTFSEFVQPKTGSINVNIINTSTIETPLTASIKVSDSGSVGNPYLGYPNTVLSSSLINPFESVIPKTTLVFGDVISSSDGNINQGEVFNNSYSDLHKNWGRASTNTHFLNYAGGTGSNGDFNHGHIDTRFRFYNVGDVEFYSASIDNPTNFTVKNHFQSQTQITDGPAKNVRYFTVLDQTALTFANFELLSSPSNFEANSQLGLRLGKTKKMLKISNFNNIAGNQQLLLPRNHVSRFANNFKDTMYKGAQNTNPGILNVKQEDVHSASFYRIKVTGGEQVLYVGGSKPSTDGDDKIIYDDIGNG